MTNWIPISAKKPPIHKAVLITDGTNILLAAVRTGKECDDWYCWGVQGYEWDWDGDNLSFTHWMPLPELPK